MKFTSMAVLAPRTRQRSVLLAFATLGLLACSSPTWDGDENRDDGVAGETDESKDSGATKKADAAADAQNEVDAGESEANSNHNDASAAVSDAAIAPADSGQPPCVPATETCNGMDDDCDGTADEGLKNSCGGDLCAAPEVAKKGAECTVMDAECVGSGSWKCDSTKGNNDVYCDVTSRVPRNLLADPGFETQTSASIAAPWVNAKGGSIGKSAHSGSQAATVVADVDWQEVVQTVEVMPHATYELVAWVQSRANYVRLGARGATEYGATEFRFPPESLPSPWTRVRTEFTTDDATTALIYFMCTDEDTGAPQQMIVDDFSLSRLGACQ